MKLWLCGDHHTGTTFFYETFLKVAKATNEIYFTTTATKEFTPNHFNVNPLIIPQNFESRYNNSSPLRCNHEKFIKAASNYQGGFRKGMQRLEDIFSCYKENNLLVSEPTNFVFGLIDFNSIHKIYDKMLEKNGVLMVFVVRNPVDLECSRWARLLINFAQNKVVKNSEKSKNHNLIKDHLMESGYLEEMGRQLLMNGSFIVDYFPEIARTTTRDLRKRGESYYSFYKNLMQWSTQCENIKITTYEKLFADINQSIKGMIKYLAPSALENNIVSEEINQLENKRINSADKRLIFSEKVKDKMKCLHPEGIRIWENISQQIDNNIFTL